MQLVLSVLAQSKLSSKYVNRSTLSFLKGLRISSPNSLLSSRVLSTRRTGPTKLVPSNFFNSQRTSGIWRSNRVLPSTFWNSFRSSQSRFFSPNARFANLSLTAKTSSVVQESLNSTLESKLPVLSPPHVAYWLLFSSLLVYAVIVVGGVTRLTESGLSITEWKPFAGTIPPLSQRDWEDEFEKYKATPEFKMLNSNFTLDDFKRIFYMEWGHRVLGRVVGLTFVIPFIFYAARRHLGPGLAPRLAGMAVLVGAQGALGWYMVKSGLEDSIMEKPGSVPRVSQYRLAAHLGLAVVLFAAMHFTGLAILKDWRYATKGLWNGLAGSRWKTVLANPIVRSFRTKAWVLSGLVFLTAISGAFVAGLDAGLLYNEFPLMGGRLAPPGDELMNPAYATKDDHSDLWWRNIFENPTTVQFDHRVLATTTYISSGLLYAISRSPALRATLPAATLRLTGLTFAIANVQVLLGISTLLYLVPVPLAAAHQAGSVALLTAALALAMGLRRPGAAAQLWRARMSRN